MSFAEVAADALRWVAGQGVAAPGGAAWTEVGVRVDDLYSGTAGILVACAEATRSGLSCDAMASAARGRLLRLSGEPAAGPAGLFEGAPGMLVALRAWAAASGDSSGDEAADRLVRAISARVVDGSDPRRPYDVISGDAGTLIALVPEDPALVGPAAAALVDRLLLAGERSELGLQWRMDPGDKDRLMPGFSHGTAGVAYALLLAAGPLGRPELVDLAAEAGRSLIKIAHTREAWLLPNRLPPTRHPPGVSFGWCHGPAGTVRLFTALADVDPDPQWQQAISDCVQALRDSGLPKRASPGFWDNHGRCCGTAGVGQTLLDLHFVTGAPELLAWAADLADNVVSYATSDGEGTRWSNFEHTLPVPDLPPEPGLMQGTAGIAGWLARLAAAQAGRAGQSPTCF